MTCVASMGAKRSPKLVQLARHPFALLNLYELSMPKYCSLPKKKSKSVYVASFFLLPSLFITACTGTSKYTSNSVRYDAVAYCKSSFKFSSAFSFSNSRFVFLYTAFLY